MLISAMNAVFHGASTVSNLPLSSSSRKILSWARKVVALKVLSLVFLLLFLGPTQWHFWGGWFRYLRMSDRVRITREIVITQRCNNFQLYLILTPLKATTNGSIQPNHGAVKFFDNTGQFFTKLQLWNVLTCSMATGLPRWTNYCEHAKVNRSGLFFQTLLGTRDN